MRPTSRYRIWEKLYVQCKPNAGHNSTDTITAVKYDGSIMLWGTFLLQDLGFMSKLKEIWVDQNIWRYYKRNRNSIQKKN